MLGRGNGRSTGEGSDRYVGGSRGNLSACCWVPLSLCVLGKCPAQEARDGSSPEAGVVFPSPEASGQRFQLMMGTPHRRYMGQTTFLRMAEYERFLSPVDCSSHHPECLRDQQNALGPEESPKDRIKGEMLRVVCQERKGENQQVQAG